MSQFNSKEFTGGESITGSQFLSYVEPEKLSNEIKNMEGDEMDKPIRYAKPKYSQVKKTYQVLEPVTKKTIVMPEKVSKNVRSTKPVFVGQETDIPLPTASVIDDLCKQSVVQSFKYDSKIFESNNEAQIMQSEQEKTNYAQGSIKQSQEQLKNQNLKNSGVGKPTVYEGDAVKKTQEKTSNIQTSTHESKRGQASMVKSNIENSRVNQSKESSLILK